MSQLKEALKKKLSKQFKQVGIKDADMDAMVQRSVARTKERRRQVKEKAKLYR